MYCKLVMILNKNQNKICKLASEYNILINSVPGSGKTTTIKYIIERNPLKDVLVITYSSRLKKELRNILSDFRNVHSFHSAACMYYKSKVINDHQLISVLDKKNKKKIKFDILIIDESQDITFLYFRFILKLIRDNEISCNIILFGDRNQSIYNFNGSDSRFLSLSPSIFRNGRWTVLNLLGTYRIPEGICNFINNCILEEDDFMLKSRCKNILLSKPIYLVDNFFNQTNDNAVIKIILHLLSLGEDEGDMMILSPSTKIARQINNPLGILINLLNSNKIRYSITNPMTVTARVNPIDEGKIIISTFHQSKGLEKKYVFVYSFDDSYNLYFNKTIAARNKCPPEMYVAMTRASKLLFLLHHKANSKIKFLENKDISSFVTLVTLCDIEIKDNKSFKKMTRVLPVSILSEYTNIIELIKQVKRIEEYIEIKHLDLPDIPSNKILDDGTTIDLSDINTVIIVSMYEYIKSSKSNIRMFCLKESAKLRSSNSKSAKKVAVILSSLKKKKLPVFEVYDFILLSICFLYLKGERGKVFSYIKLSNKSPLWIRKEEIYKVISSMSRIIDITEIKEKMLLNYFRTKHNKYFTLSSLNCEIYSKVSINFGKSFMNISFLSNIYAEIINMILTQYIIKSNEHRTQGIKKLKIGDNVIFRHRSRDVSLYSSNSGNASREVSSSSENSSLEDGKVFILSGVVRSIDGNFFRVGKNKYNISCIIKNTTYNQNNIDSNIKIRGKKNDIEEKFLLLNMPERMFVKIKKIPFNLLNEFIIKSIEVKNFNKAFLSSHDFISKALKA